MATHLIVGADRGIGEALCLHLCARGEQVVAACLEGSSTLAEKGARVETGVDVTSDSAVQAFAQRMSGTHVDVLINVAGIYLDDSLERARPSRGATPDRSECARAITGRPRPAVMS